MGVLAFIAGGLGWLFWQRGKAMDSPTPAVVVLPFRDESGDAAYLADGLPIELTASLSKVEKLRVVSWNSAVEYRGKTDLRQLKDRLQAGAVLEGSVGKKADRLRIAVKLLDASTGESIWSDNFDKPETQVFQIEEEIAKAIVYSLKVQLRVDPQRILVPPRTQSMAAFRHYLEARSAGLGRAREWALQAIQEDPKYAPAYGLLAMNYVFSSLRLPGAWREARETARKAIALDGSTAEAHTALGLALGLGDWDFKAAQVELERSLQWSPGSSDAHAAMAIGYLAPMARLEEAEYEARKALELDPKSFWANWVTGYVLLARGKNAEAAERYRAALAIDDSVPAVKDELSLAVNGAAGRQFSFESVEVGNPRAVFVQVDPRYATVRADSRYPEILKKLKLRE
jgi:serine/threonine-protein kinase